MNPAPTHAPNTTNATASSTERVPLAEFQKRMRQRQALAAAYVKSYAEGYAKADAEACAEVFAAMESERVPLAEFQKRMRQRQAFLEGSAKAYAEVLAVAVAVAVAMEQAQSLDVASAVRGGELSIPMDDHAAVAPNSLPHLLITHRNQTETDYGIPAMNFAPIIPGQGPPLPSTPANMFTCVDVSMDRVARRKLDEGAYEVMNLPSLVAGAPLEVSIKGGYSRLILL